MLPKPPVRSAARVLPKGTRVVLVGLTTRTDLNGLCASIHSFDPAKSRYTVQLEGSGQPNLRLRAENLDLASPDEGYALSDEGQPPADKGQAPVEEGCKEISASGLESHSGKRRASSWAEADDSSSAPKVCCSISVCTHVPSTRPPDRVHTPAGGRSDAA